MKNKKDMGARDEPLWLEQSLLTLAKEKRVSHPRRTTKDKLKKKIESELNLLYDFISAEENSDFGFSLSQSYERIDYLKKVLHSLSGTNG